MSFIRNIINKIHINLFKIVFFSNKISITIKNNKKNYINYSYKTLEALTISNNKMFPFLIVTFKVIELNQKIYDYILRNELRDTPEEYNVLLI